MTDHIADTTTTTRSDTLRALAERVEAGCDLAQAISEASLLVRFSASDGARVYDFWRARAYLDAVAALQEAVLPGWRPCGLLRCKDGRTRFDIAAPGDEDFVAGYGATLCQAWLAACLRALAMEAERG